MKIKVLGSGSSGNCYFISDGKTELMLDAGLPFKTIQKERNFQLSNVSAALVTHCHMDHCKAVAELMCNGIDVYSSAGTFEALNLGGYRAKTVKALENFTVGTFQILAFDVQHDAPESLGFLIYSKVTNEKLLYFTDTYYLKYKFQGLTHIMAECNYHKGILANNLKNGRVHPAVAPRILKSHMSLENFLTFLSANDLSRVEQIHLLHLSDTNSDEALFKKEVQKLTGVEVYVH